MRDYIALIHKDADSDYGVSFPDLPGCVTAGSTLDEARAMAVEALALHVRGLVEDGGAVPEPSSLEEVMADPENRDGVAVLVALADSQPRAVRVNITLPEPDLEEIDAFAERRGLTRSGFLLKAARQAMSSELERA
jgi:predicted RNase H-like HicB family nuclease